MSSWNFFTILPVWYFLKGNKHVSFQATENSRQRKESSRTTKEENGKGSTEANEEGTKQNRCKTFITNVLPMS